MRSPKISTWIILICLSVLFTHCQQPQQDDQTQQQTEEIDPQEKFQVHTTFRVEGMTCSGCENTVETGVKEIDGVLEVTANHTDSTAMVVYDSTQTSRDVIKNGINNTGYHVSND